MQAGVRLTGREREPHMKFRKPRKGGKNFLETSAIASSVTNDTD